MFPDQFDFTKLEENDKTIFTENFHRTQRKYTLNKFYTSSPQTNISGEDHQLYLVQYVS